MTRRAVNIASSAPSNTPTHCAHNTRARTHTVVVQHSEHLLRLGWREHEPKLVQAALEVREVDAAAALHAAPEHFHGLPTLAAGVLGALFKLFLGGRGVKGKGGLG